jgi:hypothetical protein
VRMRSVRVCPAPPSAIQDVLSASHCDSGAGVSMNSSGAFSERGRQSLNHAVLVPFSNWFSTLW